MRWNVVIGGQLFLEKLPRLHILQNGFCDPGGAASRNYPDITTVWDSLRISKAVAAMAEERGGNMRRAPCVGLRPRKRASNSKS